MKNKRNEDLAVTDYTSEGTTGPWQAVDRYGRTLTSPLGGAGIIDFNWDYVAATYPLSTQEVYTFKTGGAGGTTQGVITITYTDATKASIDTVVRS